MFLTFLLSLFSVHLWAIDPRIDYQVIETDHFEVIYDARQKFVAIEYATQAEYSYNVLEKIFGEAPAKTVIVIDSTTDLANGAATSVPRPLIYGFPVLPSGLSTIDNYSVWSQELIVHEYTHILNMQPAGGFWTPMRWIFGSIIKPNMFLPRWYLEGLAVEIESRLTTHGRLRSADYAAMIRSEVVDGTWGSEDISRINEVSIPTWPRGQRPYYYGALLWHHIVQEKDIDIIGRWNQRYSHRMPWFIEGPAKDDFKANFQSILTDAYGRYASMAKQQLDEIEKGGVVTRGTEIPVKSGVMSFSPTLSPDQSKLAFVTAIDTGDTTLQLIERKENYFGGRPKQLLITTDTTRVGWFPDSEKIVFDQTDDFDRYHTFYDLYVYNLKNKKKDRITKGLRAQEPSVSPDGNTIVFIQSGPGSTTISTVSAKGANLKVLYKPEFQVRVSQPSFLNDNKIVFSERALDGNEYLKVLDIENQAVNTVLPQYSGSRFPVVTKQGIIFTNNKSGVDNLFLTDRTFSNVKALTNTKTKVLNGELDSRTNNLYISHLSSRGFGLERVKVPSVVVGTPKVESDLAKDFPAEINSKAVKVKSKTYPYSSTSYLMPQYWLPGFLILTDGFIVGANVEAMDPLGLQALSLSAEYDSRSQEPSFSALYLQNTGYGTLTFLAYDLNVYSPAYGSTAGNRGGSITYSNYIWGLNNKWRALLGISYELIDDPILKSSNNPTLHRDFDYYGPTVGISYDDTSKKGYQISPVGKKFFLNYTQFLQNATRTEHGKGIFDGTYYHTKWLPPNNVFMLRGQAYYTKVNRSVLLGSSTVTATPVIQVGDSPFVMRGFPSGEFVGWQTYEATAEYRFPLAYPYKGFGTAPLFLQKISMSLFGDFLHFNGFYFNEHNDAIRNRGRNVFSSYGTEIVFDITGFYHAPMQFKLGFAQGTHPGANGSSVIYSTLGL